MKKYSSTFLRSILGIMVLVLAVNLAYSQREPNDPGVNYQYEMKLERPHVYPELGYGVDALIPVGAFDNYMVSTSNGFAETDICVNPSNPLNFVATDNRITGYAGARYIYYTLDGGVTWSTSTSVTANQGDPVFACDSAGTFYCAILNSGVFVWKSVNGGATWTGPTTIVSNSNADKEWIWADQTNGVYKNNVYMAYVNFATGGNVDFWRSTNNGASWTGPTNMGTGNPNPGPNITVGPTGRLYVGWYNSSGTAVKVSTDGGATFGASVQASSHSNPGAVNSSGRYVLKTDIRVNGMPQLASDMTNGPYRGYVYNCYATNPPGPDAADIYMTRSTDGGVSWSASPVRVNDDVFGTLYDQWMCDVSVDNTGKVWAFWWDSRNDASNLLTETWAAVSTDGGATFMPNFKISSQWNPATVKVYQGTAHYYLGDYQGMSGKAFTFPFYTGQNNTLQDFTAYLPDYGISFKKSVDSISQNGYGVNVVRAPMMGPFSGAVTYTASVSPSPSPGTINFTWLPGNVKNFTGAPDSLSLQAVVSSNVPMATYTVTVTAVQNGGPRTHNRTYNILVGNFTGISQHGSDIPQAYQLSQNFPNPFNPSTVIYYSIPKQELVNLRVYDILGREVEALVKDQLQNPSEYQVTFDASKLTSGIYYYKLTAGEFSDVRKMVLIK